MVISASADVLVVNGWSSRLCASRRRSIEAPLQDGFDMSIRPCPHTERSVTGRFHPVVAVALGESQDPKARPEALLWVRSLSQDLVSKLACCGAKFLRPGEDSRRRPLGLRSMRARHVLRDGGEAASHAGPAVRPHPVAVVEDLDR